jgi:CMP-N,N'-diacetyllegionaminic acid synthase
MKIIAIIPARGGSKRIPKKNIKKLGGKPLIGYTIEAAIESKKLDDIIVSTENKEINDVAEKFGAKVIERPNVLATDWAKTIDVVLDVLTKEECGVVVLLQPTCPFRTAQDIDGAIKLFLMSKCDSVISMAEAGSNQCWLMKIKGNKFLTPVFGHKYFTQRSQDLPKMYVPNGAIYVSTPANLRKYKSFYTNKVLPYIMPRERSIDIDDFDDWAIAEQKVKCQHL